MSYQAKILLDSITEAGDRLTTMEVTFPRFVLAEFNTHRAFSRNSASSRAIPVQQQIDRVLNDPFIPRFWGANQPGMQAVHEIPKENREMAAEVWRELIEFTADRVQRLVELKAHKQTAARPLEPYMWQTAIVSATEWENFFALRANPDAQPEIRVISEMMQSEYRRSTPALVRSGEWHMPLVQPDERKKAMRNSDLWCKISSARCARISYLTHDGKRDLDADLRLYNRLLSGGHMSPLEHVATPDVDYMLFKRPSNFRGWRQLRKLMPHEDDFSKR